VRASIGHQGSELCEGFFLKQIEILFGDGSHVRPREFDSSVH
jgi:hypothetical protein